MIVEVLYFAEFKDITEKEKEKFEFSKDHLKDLIDLLIEKYGKKIQNLIWDEDAQKIHSLISTIINNQAIHEKNPSIVKLNDGDTIAFLMPVSGG
ncbi:MAG: MoaD/ThiS family protein [Candidatus Lokiarchaeota archaeon]|nr:MoaD/ThiS family protein [Candidatus Lokiarchaeota archaeon]